MKFETITPENQIYKIFLTLNIHWTSASYPSHSLQSLLFRFPLSYLKCWGKSMSQISSLCLDSHYEMFVNVWPADPKNMRPIKIDVFTLSSNF